MNQFTRRQFVSGTSLIAGSLALVACGKQEAETTEEPVEETAQDTLADATDAADIELVNDGTLTVVAELGFAPFEYIPEGETDPVGFDIDFANELATRMGLACEFLPNQAFDTLVPTIKEGGKADVAISGITITDERAEEIDFSDPYFDSNQAVVVKDGSEETLETLDAEGKQVACQSGTTGNDWIVENLTHATCVPLADVTAGEMGVSTGSYDAYVIDLPVATEDIKNSFNDLAVLEEIPTGEQLGVVVSKDNPALTAAINAALAEMVADGTLEDLKNKWMPTE